MSSTVSLTGNLLRSGGEAVQRVSSFGRSEPAGGGAGAPPRPVPAPSRPSRRDRPDDPFAARGNFARRGFV